MPNSHLLNKCNVEIIEVTLSQQSIIRFLPRHFTAALREKDLHVVNYRENTKRWIFNNKDFILIEDAALISKYSLFYK